MGGTDSKKYYDKTAVAINVHTRGEKTICSGGWSQGCLLIDYARDSVNSKGIPEYERFIKAVYPTSVTTKEGDGQLTLGAYKNVKISRIQTGRYNSVGTLVIDRFLYQDEMDALYGVPAAVDLIVANSVSAEKKMPSTLKISAYLDTTAILQGSSCNINGVVDSTCKISSVTGKIVRKGSSAAIQTKTITSSASYITLKSTVINSGLKFGSLAAGDYQLIISAVDELNQKASVTINFSVGTAKPTISASMATTTITKGKGCNITGNISSRATIVNVTGVILKGSTEMQKVVIRPYTTSVELKTSLINQNLRFGSLPVGEYTLRITAQNSVGTEVKNIKFIVK